MVNDSSMQRGGASSISCVCLGLVCVSCEVYVTSVSSGRGGYYVCKKVWLVCLQGGVASVSLWGCVTRTCDSIPTYA